MAGARVADRAKKKAAAAKKKRLAREKAQRERGERIMRKVEAAKRAARQKKLGIRRGAKGKIIEQKV